MLLVAAVWLVPRMFRDRVAVRSAEGTRLLAVYVFGLALLRAALGRCDPIHVFFDGSVMLLLSLVAVSGCGRGAQRAWMGAFAVLVLWGHFVNDRLFVGRTADVLRLSVMPGMSEPAREAVLGAVRRVRPRLAQELDPREHREAEVRLAAVSGITGGAGDCDAVSGESGV